MNYDKNLLYGRLKILEEVDKDKYGKRMVKTICTCGSNKIQIKDLYSILVGKNKSCGCLQKEIGYIQSQKNRKQNIYNLTKEYGIGYTFKGEEFYFDLEDYDKIKNICWYKTHNGYIKSNVAKTTLHRLVMDNIKDKTIDLDHINGKKHDNRKFNLRIVNRSQNNMNSKPKSKIGTKGIHWLNNCNKWQVRLTVYKNTINYYCDSILEAINIRISLEKEYFREYRYAWENEIDINKLIEYENKLKNNKEE